MICIDKEKCIGCGKCVKDCFPMHLEVVDGKAVAKAGTCMECGHCIAICPKGAVSLEGADPAEILELDQIDYRVDANHYLNQMKTRRSIRQFQETPVSEEDLHMILEAGRYSPTGGNLQNVSYYVSQKDITNLKTMLIDTLGAMGEAVKASGSKISWYSDFWIGLRENYHKKNIDHLFFDAGTVILISSDSPQSACLAAAHMETMIYSLGLGMLYSGFSARAVQFSQKLKEYLQLKPGYDVHAVLVIGHPDVVYERTVPRKPLDLIRN